MGRAVCWCGGLFFVVFWLVFCLWVFFLLFSFSANDLLWMHSVILTVGLGPDLEPLRVYSFSHVKNFIDFTGNSNR